MSSTIKRRSTPNTRGEQTAYESALAQQTNTIVIDVKPHTPVQKYTQYVPVIVTGHQHPAAGIVIQSSPGFVHQVATPPGFVHQVVTPSGLCQVSTPSGIQILKSQPSVNLIATPYDIGQDVTPHIIIPVQPKFQFGYPPHFIRY